jgi:predicted Zn finger-like uncharacterized protein
MLTRCDRCGTWFRVRKEQLAVADGWVRCGHCGQTFLAESSLLDEPTLKEGIQSPRPIGLENQNPSLAVRPIQVEPHQEPEPVLGLQPEAREENLHLQELVPGLAASASPLESPSDDTPKASPVSEALSIHAEIGDPDARIPAALLASRSGIRTAETEIEPESVIPPQKPPGNSLLEHRSSAFWAIGSVLAIGLIIFEALAISRHGRTPDIVSLSPTLESPSSGKAPLSPAQVRILSAEVRKSKSAPGGLAIEGTLFNASTHGLAFPQLLVRFTNLEGRIVDEGVFPPADYLPIQTRDPIIPAHGAVGFRLRVIDPGAKAVGFSLRSCLPPQGNATFCGSP